MNLMDLFIKIGVDDQASKEIPGITNAFKNAGSAIANGLVTAAKIGMAAIGAAATGIAAIAKSSVTQYAEYEQLVGGVETLFKSSADKVQKYAENAYKTAGVSANEYMATVTSFSASLLQSLGGDTDAAVEYADRAITDMADNANKMGTSMEMIQNAYQGFAKQNYTMLDNLKLGYGGTKNEMERLLQDADALSESFNLVKDKNGDLAYSFADIVEAIHIVQDDMGIAGTTAQEASETISGSIISMKAAWGNLVTGFSDPNADIGVLISNLVDTAKTALGNLIPVVKQTLTGISEAIGQLAPVIGAELPAIISELVPSLLSSATTLLESLINGIVSALPSLLTSIVDQLPGIVDTIFSALSALLSSIGTDILPVLLPSVFDAIFGIANSVIDNLPVILDAVTNTIMSLIGMLPGLFETTIPMLLDINQKLFADVIPDLISTILALLPDLINSIVGFLSSAYPQYFEAAKTLFMAVAEVIPELIPEILLSLPDLISSVISFFSDAYPLMIEGIIGFWLAIVDAIPEIQKQLLPRLPEIYEAIVTSLLDAAPELLKAAVELWYQLVIAFGDFLVDLPATLWQLSVTAGETIFKMGATFFKLSGDLLNRMLEGFKYAWESIKAWFSTAFQGIVAFFNASEQIDHLKKTGQNIIDGLKSGISTAWKNLKTWFQGLFGDLIGIAKKILGIASPSKVFKKLGGWTAEGFGIGFDDKFSDVKDGIEDAMAFDDIEIGANVSRVGSFGNSGNVQNGGITLTQNIYSEAKTAADLMQEALYHQERAVLLGV